MYKLIKIVGKPEFSDQFSKIVICYKRKGYNIDVIKQSACLALTQSWLTTLLTYLFAGWSVFILYDTSSDFKIIHLDGLGQNFLCLFLGPTGFN